MVALGLAKRDEHIVVVVDGGCFELIDNTAIEERHGEERRGPAKWWRSGLWSGSRGRLLLGAKGARGDWCLWMAKSRLLTGADDQTLDAMQSPKLQVENCAAGKLVDCEVDR